MLKKNITQPAPQVLPTNPTAEPAKTTTVTPEQYLNRLQTVTIPALIRRIADLEATIDRMNQTELNIKRILAASEQLDIVIEDGQNHKFQIVNFMNGDQKVASFTLPIRYGKNTATAADMPEWAQEL